MTGTWLVLAAGLLLAVPCLGTICPPGAPYWPELEDCSSYVQCPPPGNTKVRDVPQRCWWFRRFSRADLRCEWFWNVDCTLDPVIPPFTERPSTEMPTIPWPDD